jgi:hypothetical protein
MPNPGEATAMRRYPMTRSIAAAALMCILVPCALAQEKGTISGSWDIKIDVAGNGADFTCNITQQDKTLKGTCGELGELKGTVADETYTWSTQGGASPLTFTGKLKEGKLAGTVDVTAYAVQGEFIGTMGK